MAHVKGIAFSIDQTAHQHDERAKPVSTAKDARTNYRIQAIRDAPNITASEYDELTRRKKQGQTTTEDNFKVERFFWQSYLVQKDPDPDLLVEFMYGNNPLNHFVSLVDMRNHRKEDNLRSAKFIERTNTINTLLVGLGFSSVMDRDKIDKDTFTDNWCEHIVGKPEFQSKRLNEIFNLTQRHQIRTDMTTRQILAWVNVLLKHCALVVRSVRGKHYRLEEKY